MTATSSSGSSSTVPHVWPASRSASAPAVWNAASEESTLCALPSTSVARTSTTGWCSSVSPRSSWVRMPFSTLGMNCVGTAPPTTWETNSNPEPRGSGSNSTWQTAYWPCPPDCLTCRPGHPRRVADRGAQRHLDRLGVDLGAARPQPGQHDVGVRLAHAPQHRLVGLGVALEPQRRVRGDEPGERPAQRVFVGAAAGDDRDRQQRVGQVPARQQQRVRRGGDGVAGLGGAELRQRGDVARDAHVDLAQLRAERDVDVGEPLVGVVAAVVRGVAAVRRRAAGRAR